MIDKSNKKRLAMVLLAHGLISTMDIIAISLTALIASLSLSELRGVPLPKPFDVWLDISLLADKTFLFKVMIIALLATTFFTIRTVLGIFLNNKIYKILSNQSLNLSHSLLKKLLNTQILNDPNQKSQKTLFSITKGVDLLVIQFLGLSLATIVDAVMLCAIATGLFLYDIRSAVTIFAIFGTIFVFSVRHFSIRARKYGAMLSEVTAISNQHLLDTFRLFPEIRLRDNVIFFVNKAKEMRSGIVHSQAQMALLPNLTKYIYEIAIIYSALIIASIQIIISDANKAIATLVVFLAATSRIIPAFARIQNSILSINHNIASCKMTLELIAKIEKSTTGKNQKRKSSSRSRDEFRPKVDFYNVSFSYPDSNEFALSDIDLKIEEGSFVAIIGSSGAGKSTLAKLILGNLLPTNGEVKVSDHFAENVSEIWPGVISYLPQKPIIMDASILQNITLDDQVSEANVEKAKVLLREVELAEFSESSNIEKLVGESGNNLSGGQLQRLGIARALYTNPSMLILDEPTSAMDPITERIVMERVLARESCTKIVIAHRLSTISRADHIIVLKHGKIEASDTFEVVSKSHSQLLKGIELK